MPGQRMRLLLIAIVAVGLCNYELLTGRNRSKPTLNPRIIESEPGASTGAEPAAAATQAGYNRFPTQRAQETTIRPRTSSQSFAGQAQPVNALEKQAVIDLVQTAIDKTSRRYLDADVYTPWQMMHGVLALRGDYKLKRKGQVVSAIDFISSGPTFRGDYWWEKTAAGGRGHPYSVPYHFEGHINQFPAMLSMSALPLNHQLVAKGGTITIADIVRNAQRTVNTNEELTWTLWLLTQYINQDDTWVNQQGQRWSMSDLVRLQVAENVNEAPCGGTHQLFALAFSRNAYLKQHGQLRGSWVTAEYKLRTHIEIARNSQNADGSFSANFFKGGGYAPDFKERIRTSGHMLEWLMMALPASRLDEPWVRRGIQAVANDLIRNASAPADCGPMYHALHALILYRERVAPPPTTKPSEQLASTTRPSAAPPTVGQPAVPAAPVAKQEGALAVKAQPAPAIPMSKPGIVVLSPAAPATTSQQPAVTSQQPVVVVKTKVPGTAPPAMLTPADARPITLSPVEAEPVPALAATGAKPTPRPPLVLKPAVPEANAEPKVATSTEPKPTDAPATVAATAPTTEPQAPTETAMPTPTTTTLPSTSLVKSSLPESAPSDSDAVEHPADLPLAAAAAEHPGDLPSAIVLGTHPADLPVEVASLPATPIGPDMAVAADQPILPEVTAEVTDTSVPSGGPVTGLTIETTGVDAQDNPTGKPAIETAPVAPIRVSEAVEADQVIR